MYLTPNTRDGKFAKQSLTCIDRSNGHTSFHCTDDECERPKCRELKLVLERMQDHTEQCPAMRTPLGAPVKDCKTCRLYKALTRTRPGSASARPRRTSPLMSSLR
jgi:hypothetical protein